MPQLGSWSQYAVSLPKFLYQSANNESRRDIKPHVRLKACVRGRKLKFSYVGLEMDFKPNFSFVHFKPNIAKVGDIAWEVQARWCDGHKLTSCLKVAITFILDGLMLITGRRKKKSGRENCHFTLIMGSDMVQPGILTPPLIIHPLTGGNIFLNECFPLPKSHYQGGTGWNWDSHLNQATHLVACNQERIW